MALNKCHTILFIRQVPIFYFNCEKEVKLIMSSLRKVTMISLYNMPYDKLYDLLFYYDLYIREMNEKDDYALGVRPVSVEEFYNNENGGDSYQEIKKNNEKY